MEKIPTAEDFISNNNYSFIETLPGNMEACILKEDISKIMIKFAKLHVKAAIKSVAEKTVFTYKLSHDYEDLKAGFYFVAPREFILTAYPEENIK